MIEIESLDYTGSSPEVFFWYRGIDMFAALDPGVVNPVVKRGSANGFDVDIKFDEYDKLQEAINLFASKPYHKRH